MWFSFRRERERYRSSWQGFSPTLRTNIPRSGPLRDRRIDLFGVGIFLLLAWTVNSLVLSDHGFLQLRELRLEEAEKSARRVALLDTVSTLEHDERESKQERQERMAREKYKQSRPDEIVYLFDRRAPLAAPATVDSGGSKSDRKAEAPH